MERFPYLWLVLILGSVVGLAVVLLTGSTVFIALGLPVGALVAYLAVEDPLVALVILQVVSWSNISTVAGTHHGLSLYLLALALGLISLVAAAKRGARKLFGRSPLYLLLAAVVAAAGVSLLASPFPLTTLSTPVERIKDVVFFFTTIALVRVSGRYVTAIRVIVVTIAALAALTVLQQYGLHNSSTFGGLSNIPTTAGVGGATSRHSGPEGDVNFWGRTIVLVTPMCLSLCALAWATRRRWLWLLAALALAGGEYLSQSRGGLIAFAVAVILWAVVSLWRHRRWLIAIPVVLVIFVVAVPGLSSRLSTLGQLGSVNPGITDPSLVERVQAQEVGLAMFKANPATGVGLGNFTLIEPQYLSTPGVTDTGKVYAAHDLYLELAAEQGVLGLAVWGVFYCGALIVAFRGLFLSRRLHLRDQQAIATGALFSLIGWAVASVVLQMADFNDLLAILAIAAVVDMDVRARAADLPPVPPRPLVAPALRARRRRAAVGAGALAVLPLVAGLIGCIAVVHSFPLHRTVYAAEATAAVRPEAAVASGNDAYAWNTVARDTLLPTLSAIADQTAFAHTAESSLGISGANAQSVQLSTSVDITAAVLRLRIQASQPAVAVSMAAQTLNDVRVFIGGHIQLYQLEPVATGAAQPVEQLRHAVALFLMLIGLCAVLGAYQLGRIRYRAFLVAETRRSR